MSQPLYSGPNRSGTCVCGHSWQDHHLSCVMNKFYYRETHEAYVPEECCHYGSNELGGLMPNPDPDAEDRYIDHCHGYRDSLE